MQLIFKLKAETEILKQYLYKKMSRVFQGTKLICKKDRGSSIGLSSLGMLRQKTKCKGSTRLDFKFMESNKNCFNSLVQESKSLTQVNYKQYMVDVYSMYQGKEYQNLYSQKFLVLFTYFRFMPLFYGFGKDTILMIVA